MLYSRKLLATIRELADMKTNALILTLLAILSLQGCATTSSSPIDEKERQAAISSARQMVAECGLFTDAEIEKTKSEIPTMALYVISRGYTDYRVYWSLDSGEQIMIRGSGDVTRLEGAIIETNKS